MLTAADLNQGRGLAGWFDVRAGAAGFRLLGPVEAWVGERRLELGGPRQLALFAFLVLHANRAVSRDLLVDSVWGPGRDCPATRLNMAIARLRTALGPQHNGGESSLRTVSGGYLLSIGPGDLDAELFSSAVRCGRRALDEGDPASAAELLCRALGLWRGPPLAEVYFAEFAQPEIRRLEELRWVAIETRVEAELQLGHHVQLIGELQGMLVEQPTRERVACQLMLALYRSGRQADALQIYEGIRVHLAATLGLQPGPALTDLQLKILRQSPSLAHTFTNHQDPSANAHLPEHGRSSSRPHPDPASAIAWTGHGSRPSSSATVRARLTHSYAQPS